MAEDPKENNDTATEAVAPVEQAPAQAPAAPAVALTEEEVSEKGQKLAFIANLADATGIVDEGVEDIKKTAKKVEEEIRKNPKPAPAAAPAPAAEAPAAPAAPVAATDADTPPAAGDKPNEQAPVEEPPAVADEASTFFSGKSKGKTPDFKTAEEVTEYVKERYAIDIKSPQDYQTLFNSVDKWRNDAQDHSKLSKQYEDLMGAFQDLPPQLSDAFQTWASAGDWEASLRESAGRVDFNKEFAAHAEDDMLRAYFPDELREVNGNEDLDDDQKKSQLSAYYKSAGKLYANDKQTFEVRRAEAITEQDDKQRRFKESALSSVQHLKNKYPDFSDSDLKKVQDGLVAGSVYSLLFEKDGTYKEDAGVRAALLMFGEKEIDETRKKAAAKATSEANIDLITRGGDKPTNRGGAQQQPNPTGAKEILKKIAPMIDQSPYAHIEKGD